MRALAVLAGGLWLCAGGACSTPRPATPPLSASPATSAPAKPATAVAASAAEREGFIREMNARYPRAEYLVGIGESDTSAAIAESRAIVDAAAGIRSSLKANLTAIEEGIARDGAGQVNTRVVDEILQQVETDAGAFILPRRDHTRRGSAVWFAVAVGKRAELDAKYVEEARSSVERLGHSYEQVVSAPTWIAAAPAWCELESLEAELQRRSIERRAVSGKSLWPPAELERARSDAHARHDAARASIHVSVARLTEAPEADPADAIVGALRASGWSASVATTTSCAEGGLLLRPNVSQACRHSSLGIEVCKVALEIQGRSCGNSSALFALSQEAQATDSYDPDRAVRNARKKLAVKQAAQEAVGRTLLTLGECKP